MKELFVNPKEWSAVADDYERSALPMMTPFSEEAIRWASIDHTDEVLDVASGPGTLTILAARRAKTVQAIDFSAEMISHLRRATAGLSNVSSVVGDGQALMFDSEKFSVAFSMFGLMFFPDPIAGLHQLHRVLTPGGRVLISSWVPPKCSPMMRPLMLAMKYALPAAYQPPPSPPLPFQNPESLREGLVSGGFEAVEILEFSPSIPISSAEQYWRHTRGNIFVNRVRLQAGSNWDEIEIKVLDRLRETLFGVKSLAMPSLIALGWKNGNAPKKRRR